LSACGKAWTTGKRSASCALALPASSPQRSKLCHIHTKSAYFQRELFAAPELSSTYPEELLKIRIVHSRRPIAKNDLRRQRESVSADMIEERLWLVQKALQHDLVLQILIRYVGDRGLDVKDIMNRLVNRSPERSVSLNGFVVRKCASGVEDD
jgi:hypothetical protein